MIKLSYVLSVAVIFCAAGGVMADAKVAAEAAAADAERAAEIAKDEAQTAEAALLTALGALTQSAVDIAVRDAEAAAKAAAGAAVDAEKAQAAADSAAASSATGGGSLFDVAEGNAGEEAKAAAARAAAAVKAAKASAEDAKKSAEAAAKVVAPPNKGSANSLFDMAAGGAAAGDTAAGDTAVGGANAPVSGEDDAAAGMEKDTAEVAPDAAAAKAALAEAEAKARTFKADADAALTRETEAMTALAKAEEAAREAKAVADAMEEGQARIKAKANYLGYGSVALGGGIIVYGIIENAAVSGQIGKSQFRAAENSAKTRDAAYYFGAAILLSGITIKIMF
jgi:hypothetical protein